MDEIKAVVAAVIKNLAVKQGKDSRHNIMALWEKVVDKETKKHARPLDLKEKTLRVSVDSSAWMYQLNLERMKLLAALQKEGAEIEKIFFRIGKIG